MSVDPSKVRQVRELKQPVPLMACRFDAAGRFVFASCRDFSIQRWELATAKKAVLVGHQSWVRGLVCLPRENVLISGDYHGRVLWWPADAAVPLPFRSIDAHTGWVRAVAVSPDGNLLATCGNDRLVKVWSAADGKLIRELAGHDCHVYHVAFHPNGLDLVSADHKGIVKHWDLASGTMVRQLDAGVLHKYDQSFRAEIGGARSMAFSPDGGLLACAGITNVSNAFAGVGNPVVVLFDWKLGTRRQLLTPKAAYQGTAWGVVAHPDGFWAGVSGGNGGVMSFWKPEQAQAFHELRLPNNARDLALHPDGKMLAVAFMDGAVRLYDLPEKTGG